MQTKSHEEESSVLTVNQAYLQKEQLLSIHDTFAYRASLQPSSYMLNVGYLRI